MIPCARTDSARPESASASTFLRGWRGFAWIWPSGSFASSVSDAPPSRTSRPRPRPRRSGAGLDMGELPDLGHPLDELGGDAVVGVGAGGARVVRGDRQAV